MYKEYDLVEQNENVEYVGSIFGYVTEDMDHLRNFLDKNDYDDYDISRYSGLRVGIISNLYVETDERNKGYGKTLMDRLMSRFYDHQVDCIFLVCDKIENNEFDLMAWYENYGFELAANQLECPLMINDIEG